MNQKSYLFMFILSIPVINCTQYFNENDIPEIKYMDTSVNPCDDFYQFTCGNFKNFYIRPSNQQVLDQFTILEDNLVVLGQDILSKPLSHRDPEAVKKGKIAYQACVNVQVDTNDAPEFTTINEFGGMPLISPPDTECNFSWNEIGDLAGKYGIPLVFLINVAQTSQNENAIFINNDPLSNPSMLHSRIKRNYQDLLEDDFVKYTRRSAPAAFDIFLETLAMNLLEYSNTSKNYDDITFELNQMATFMRALYTTQLSGEYIIPLDKDTTVKALQEWTNLQFNGDININWIEYLTKVFQLSGVSITEDMKIRHSGVELIYKTLKLVHETDPKIVKNFALLRVFLFQAPDSNYITRNAFETYYKAQNYQLFPRWEYCTRKILDVVDTASLSYAITYNYLHQYYEGDKLVKANNMIKNIRNSFNNLLKTSDWMDDSSRSSALAKAYNVLVLLGYPEFVNNRNDLDEFYENLKVYPCNNYDNARMIRAFKQAYQLAQLRVTDRNFWGKSTFDPNAYYNRPSNKMVIPISMLNPVFFNGSNPILDYSRLGSIIGHEITHGFDINGKEYNQDGIVDPWWSNETRQTFIDKATCFSEQYSKFYIPEINTYVQGLSSINENLADNGGLRSAYNAFETLLENSDFEATGKYTLKQLFFIGFSTMWCSDESNSALISLSRGSYPPKRFRVIGPLSNFDEFADAFNCSPGSFMNPVDKCRVW